MNRKMKKLAYSKLIPAILCLLSLVLISSNLVISRSLLVSPWIFNPETLASSAWTPILHKTFNSFILWKNLKFLSLSNNLHFELLGFSIVFILNLVILFRQLKANVILSITYSSTILLIILAILGADVFLIKALSIAPLLVFVVIKIKNAWISTFFIIAISALINILSFSLAPLILLFILLLIYLLEPKKLNLFLIFIIFIPSIIFFNQYSLTPKTDYPNDAKVVEDDGLPGHLRPAFANMSNIPFVNRVLVRKLNQEISLVILILIFGFYIREFINAKSLRNRNANILLITSAFIVADVFLPEEFASISPLATLRRIVPYFYHYPLAPYFLIFLIIKFTANCVQQKKYISLSFFLLILSGYIAIKNTPILIDKKLNGIIKNSEVKLYENFNVVSPAYALIPKLGFEVIFKKKELANLKLKKINPYNVRVSKNNFRKGSKRKFIFDNNPETRFRTKQQYAKEWVHLAFKRNKQIKGLALQTGYYPSDFPRGIRVSSAKECEFNIIENKKDLANYNEIYKKEKWIGSYKFTPSGMLYLTAEGVVNLIFNKEVNAKCLLIEQIGTDDFYDWSIAEIKLIK